MIQLTRNEQFHAIAARAASPQVDVVPYSAQEAFTQALYRIDLRHALDLDALLNADTSAFTREAAHYFAYADILDHVQPSAEFTRG